MSELPDNFKKKDLNKSISKKTGLSETLIKEFNENLIYYLNLLFLNKKKTKIKNFGSFAQIIKKIENINSNKDQAITSYKPPIFWKEKDLVKKQMSEWSEIEIKKKIYKLTDLEILVKSNTAGINLVSDFVCNY